MGKGVIYLAKCQEFYKIGHTTSDPLQRLSTLQTGNPFRVELVGTVPGTIGQERNLHYQFAHKRERGEWFKLSQEDVDSILASSPVTLPPVIERKGLRETIGEWSRQTSDTDKRLNRLEAMLMVSPPEVIAEFMAEINKIREAA